MRVIAAAAAIAVLLLTGFVGGSPAVADAAVPTPAPVRDAGSPLRLELTDMSPRVVTSDGPDTLALSGTLTNTGDTAVEDLVVRVQRGDPLDTEGEIRDALDGNAGTDAVTPQFLPLADGLAPGASVPVRLAVALRGAPETTLALSQTGVHELLVNVNGVPRGGARARLAAVRMLLPVLSLPAGAGSPAKEPADPGPSIPFSMLFPVAEAPHRLSTVPGDPVLLTDDSLATSFAPGGRLAGLVETFAQDAPPGSRTRAATCLAVDPDLLETADAMRGGYQVRGADGTTVPGKGAQAAGAWLDRLTVVARNGCVIALPYADADVVALTRGGLGTTATAAITDGREVVSDLLQTTVVPGVTWPVDGVTDDPGLDAIAKGDGTSLLLSADGVEQGRSRRSTGVVPVEGGAKRQFAVLTDPLMTLAATGPDRSVAATNVVGGAALAASPAGTDTPLSTQDAIGALAFRTLDTASGLVDPRAPLVLAPPHQWGVDAAAAHALLDAVGTLVDDGALSPRGLDTVLAAGPAPGTQGRALTYPLDAGGREIPSAVTDTIRTTAGDLTDLLSAVVPDATVGATPDEVFTPIRRGLVRPASAAWRGDDDGAQDAAGAGLEQVVELRGTIRVLEPPTPYSLGTSDAPLPLTVANDLPVTVRVLIDVSPTSGLRVAPIEEQRIPPKGRRQVSVNAQVTRSGQFTVDASLRTPDGGLLGPPSRLRVQSTAYGTITVWLTAGAGVLLVALAARRVFRRRRGEAVPTPDRPTLPVPPSDLPPGSSQDLLPAASTAPLDPSTLPPFPLHPVAADPVLAHLGEPAGPAAATAPLLPAPEDLLGTGRPPLPGSSHPHDHVPPASAPSRLTSRRPQ